MDSCSSAWSSAGPCSDTEHRSCSVGSGATARKEPAASSSSSAFARRPALRYLAFGWWGAADPPALSSAAVEGFLAGPSLHTDTTGLGRALVRDDPRVDLERVTCPCLVLWGARDNWVLLEDGFEFARRLRAPLRLIPDCGHLLIGERPDACLDAIESLVGEPRVPPR